MDIKIVADQILDLLYSASETMAEELEEEYSSALQADLGWLNQRIRDMEHVQDAIGYLVEMGRMPEKIEEVM